MRVTTLRRMRLQTVALAAALLAGAFAALAQPEPSPYVDNHLVKLDAADVLSLMDKGKPNVEIVVMRGSAPVVGFAAKELKTLLDQALGGNVPTVSNLSGDVPAIVLGDNAWTRAWGVDVKSLPRDSFVIQRRKGLKNVVIIAGRDDPRVDPERAIAGGAWEQLYERGTLFGVYDFLERFAGVRFYFPGDIGTVVPKLKEMRLPLIDVREVPDFSVRAVSWYSAPWFSEFKDNQDRFRTQNLERYRLRGDTAYTPNARGLARLGLVERFGQDRADFFARLPDDTRDNDLAKPGQHGHLCYQNDALREEICRDAEAFLTGRPATSRGVVHRYGNVWDSNNCQPGYFCITPPDGFIACECPKCLPFKESGRLGDPVWQFTAAIASRLQQNGIPGFLTSMADGAWRPVPEVELPENVLVMLAVTGPQGEETPTQQAKDDQLIRDWNAKLVPRKVWLWNRMGNDNGNVPDGVPPISTRSLAAYYPRVGPSILGAFLETDTVTFPFNYLNWYIYSKLAWNVNTDVKALVKEHHQRLFGPVAPKMGEFFIRLEDIWTRNVLGTTADTPTGPQALRPSELDLWEKIYSAAEIEGFVRLFDDAAKKLSDDAAKKPDKDDMALKRLTFFREQLLGGITRVRDQYMARKRLVEDAVLDVLPLPEGETIAIDGSLGDAAWQKVEPVRMVTTQDETIREPVVATTLRALWTREFLYLAYDCQETRIGDLILHDLPRDAEGMWNDATVEAFFNPSGDRLGCYQFILTAKGCVADIVHTRDTENKLTGDAQWNCEVQTAAQVGEGRWTAEMAIPLKALGIENVQAGTEIVANFTRGRHVQNVPREEDQKYTWSAAVASGFLEPKQYGRVRLVERKTPSDWVVRNGGFENGETLEAISDWSIPKDAVEKGVVALDSDIVYEGRRSIRIANVVEKDMKDPTGGCRVTVTQPLPDLKPSTRYLLTFFFRTDKVEGTDAASSAGAAVNVWAPGNLWFPPDGYRGSNAWTKQGFEFTTPPEAGPASAIKLSLWDANGTVWFDDIRVRPLE